MSSRRLRRSGRRQWKKEDSDYDSDDPRSYRDTSDPDPTSRDYIYDEVDEYHEDNDKILLDVVQTRQQDQGSDKEEEVLGWNEDDSDEELEKKAKEFDKYHHVDEMASDLEEEKDEDETTDDKAWGKRKKQFHGTDFIGDNILDNLQEDEEEDQAAEEEEARLIQRRMAEALDEGDFTMDLIQSVPTEEGDEEIEAEEDKVKKDLSKLTKQEKLQILKKESPELLELVDDCKAKLQEVKDMLQPLMNMVKEGRVPSNTLGVTYLQTKYHLYLNYCLNINFYLVMKAKQLSVKNHPVIGRILAYRKLINELKPADDQIRDEIERLLGERNEMIDNRSEVKPSKEKMGQRKGKKRHKEKKLSSLLEDSDDEDAKKVVSRDNNLTEQEMEGLKYYKKMEAKRSQRKEMQRELYAAEDEEAGVGEEKELEDDNGEEKMQEDEEGKRAITYQISKNKGLTTRKKKELRNPRVKNRSKFRKAKIRRKGQVQEVRTELQRYGGELSGIRASVVKSVKLK